MRKAGTFLSSITTNDKKNVFKDSGLTLIELLIALLVIAAIAGIAIFRLSGNSTDATKKGCAQDAATLYSALNNWYLAPSGGNGSFPTATGVSVPYSAGVSVVPNSSGTVSPISAATANGNLVTYIGTSLNFSIGQTVSVTGFTSNSYNITGRVLNPTSTSFQIIASSSVLPVTATGTGNAQSLSVYAFTPFITNLNIALTGASASGSTITFQGSGFSLVSGQIISISGFTSSAYNVSGTVSAPTATSFQVITTGVVSPTTASGSGSGLVNDLYYLVPSYINKIPTEVTAYLLTTDPNGNPLSVPTIAVTGAQPGCTAGL